MSSVLVLFTLGWATLTGTAAADSAAQATGPSCSSVSFPVSLAPGLPADQHIDGRLCVPDRPTSAVQVLVHGITYDKSYWDFRVPGNPSDQYDYQSHANEAGYATLAIDRLGAGASSHPLSTALTVESNAFTVHQVIQALRHGTVTGGDGRPFEKVLYVGHSYGTFIGWYEVSTYHDVDAAVFTAATGKASVTGMATGLPAMYPAALDPAFAGRGLDPGYLTTRPGTRYDAFYAPAQADPAVVAHDEATKQTLAATEVADFPRILTQPQDIRVPVFVVVGDHDGLFCTENTAGLPAPAQAPVGAALGPLQDGFLPQTGALVGIRVGATDCSSPAALIADERGHFGPAVPSVGAYILPGAGHDLNMAADAPDYFAAVNTWADHTIGH